MNEPVFLDLETYADQQYSLSKLSEVQYILDPRFELLSVAASVDRRVRVWRGDSLEWLEQFKRWEVEGRCFVAHHARFDLRVLLLQFHFRPRLVGDSCSLARYFWFAEHGLDTLAKTQFGFGKQGAAPMGGTSATSPRTSGATWRDTTLPTSCCVADCGCDSPRYFPLPNWTSSSRPS